MIAEASTSRTSEEVKSEDLVVSPPAANAGTTFGGRNEARNNRG
jgi:hypothetical protein